MKQDEKRPGDSKDSRVYINDDQKELSTTRSLLNTSSIILIIYDPSRLYIILY